MCQKLKRLTSKRSNYIANYANTSVAVVGISDNPRIEKNLLEPPINLDPFDILTGPTPNNPRDHYSTILVQYLVPNKPIVLTGIPKNYACHQWVMLTYLMFTQPFLRTSKN